MAIAYFNGAEPSDVDAFEAMRGAGAGADDASAVRAVWRGATGRAACGETAARCGGPDPSRSASRGALGGHDGFAVHVDDETAKFHNYTVRSAGMIFTPDAHQLTTPRSRLIHGRRTNVRNVELGKKYPARDAFRFSSSSPDEAVAILAEVMRAATPQVMTKAQT